MSKISLKNATAEQEVCFQVLKEFICSDDRIKSAYLFGSMARGDGDNSSDLDFLIIADPQYNFRTIH